MRQRLERLRLSHSRLSAIRDVAVQRESELAVTVGQAKGRLELKDEVEGAIEGLQRLAHERSVGVFERLLSAILGDVLPAKGAVKLLLGTERGLPALDIQIQNGEALEDALE